jgi:hypothetical protein
LQNIWCKCVFAWNVNRTWERCTHQYVRLKNLNAKKPFNIIRVQHFWDLKRLIQVIPPYSCFVPNLSLLSLLSSNLRSNKTNPSKASKDRKPIITYHKNKYFEKTNLSRPQIVSGKFFGSDKFRFPVKRSLKKNCSVFNNQSL